MTHGANYKWGKLHHSHWNSDIRNSNQLNTSPGRLSRPYHKNTNQQRRSRANQSSWISLKLTCPINLLSEGFPNCISNSNSDTIPVTISEATKAISIAVPNSNPEIISESNHNHSHCSTLLQEWRLRQWLFKAVGEHLSTLYVTQVNLSSSSHICSRIVLGRNVCNCGSVVGSFLDARDQWLWKREQMRDSQDGELVQEMRDQCQCYAEDSESIVFGIGCVLRSWLLFPGSSVRRSSEGGDLSTCWYIVIRASSKVRIDKTSRCAFSNSSKCSFSNWSSECPSTTQLPVLCPFEVPRHPLERSHMLIARDVILPPENFNSKCDNGVSHYHCVHTASNHQLVYGHIAGFFIGLSHVKKLHCHWRGNGPGLVHSELRQDCLTEAALMDVDCVVLPIAFIVYADIEGDTPKSMHPEPPLHLVLDLPSHALVSNVEKIIDVQCDCSNDQGWSLTMQHTQSSVDTWCPNPIQIAQSWKVPCQTCEDYFRP